MKKLKLCPFLPTGDLCPFGTSPEGRQSKIKNFRKQYPKFIYKNYSYEITGGDLKISFFFKIDPDIEFKPKIIIKNINKKRVAKIGENVLNNFIFHLGLIEIPSYWKATCSPEIIIEAGYLNKEQIDWWKNLIINGMGQFFYENKIDWRENNFLKIIPKGKNSQKKFTKNLKDRHLVPIGGGKDTIVTLENLKKQREKIIGFSVNPTKITRKILEIAGIKNSVIVKREIDPLLLKLNKTGFLNGHTPFTALISFLSVFCAVIFDCKSVVFSCEKSADEGNIKYLGKIINHQWAKSSEFEKIFKKYCKKYLAKDINYYSYLRKYSELEIAKMFTKYPQYFSVFSSCNVMAKPTSAKSYGGARRWCGNCPKCLFVYLVLYPFLDKNQLLRIFGEDLFEKKELLPIMKSLIGKNKVKPFECVGTKKETRLAFNLSLKKAKKSGEIPYLLKKVNEIK